MSFRMANKADENEIEATKPLDTGTNNIGPTETSNFGAFIKKFSNTSSCGESFEVW